MAQVDVLRAKLVKDMESWKAHVKTVEESIAYDESIADWLAEQFEEALAPLTLDDFDGKPLCVVTAELGQPIPLKRREVICTYRPKRIVISLGRKQFSFSPKMSSNGELQSFESDLHDAPRFVPELGRVLMIVSRDGDSYSGVNRDSLVNVLMAMYDLE